MATNKKGQARMWIGTFNKKAEGIAPEAAEYYLRRWHELGGAQFVTGQIESGKEGTHHIQFFLHMQKKVTMSALKKHCPHAHY